MKTEWENKNPRKKENTERVQDPAVDAGLTGQLFDGTTYICVGTVSEK